MTTYVHNMPCTVCICVYSYSCLFDGHGLCFVNSSQEYDAGISIEDIPAASLLEVPAAPDHSAELTGRHIVIACHSVH